jgi:hypothetical protein
MGVLQAGKQLIEQLQLFGQRDGPPAGDDVGKRLAFHVLHHEKWTVEEGTRLKDRDDVGMTERASGTRFRDEPSTQIVFVEPVVQELDGDEAIHIWIAREEHTAHTAASNPAQHVELVDPLNGWRDHDGNVARQSYGKGFIR